MERNLKSILSGRAFYATLAVCLLAAGVGGSYFLLREPAPKEEIPEPPVHTQVSAPTVEITVPEEPDTVETLQPAPVEETPAPMPEIQIDDTPVVAEAPRLVVSPLQGEILAAFSMDALVYNETLEDWRVHEGIDIAAKPGTTVLAASSGTVLSVENDPLMGTTVVLEHAGGYQTTYANLQQRPNVKAGDSVSAGQIIGAVGTTAAAESGRSPHLHFSVTQEGVIIDPNEFLKR